MSFLFSLECLQVIWWGLLGVLLIGFAIFGGIDLGVTSLLTFLSKTDGERRVMIRTISPSWEGNQVWLILGGGAIFAAWPTVYAVAFSNFYFAMLLVLLFLILRPVGLEFRSKVEKTEWRTSWDVALTLCGIIPSVVFGVAVGNVMRGINFEMDEFMFLKNSTDFFSLFSPFTLLCGLVSLSMIITQGCAFLVLKTEGDIQNGAKKILHFSPLLTAIFFILGGLLAHNIDGFLITHGVVGMKNGALLDNYNKYNWFVVAPALGVLFSLIAWVCSLMKKYCFVIIANSISMLGIISTVGLSMFPFILPSKTDYSSSLTVWNSSSSQISLLIMLIAAVIFMPLILMYTAWAYKVMFGKVTENDIKSKQKEVY